MQKQPKPKIPMAGKPIIRGSWHGKDAWRLSRKVAASVLVVSFVYLLLSLMLGFDSLWLRAVLAAALVAAAAGYLYAMGMRYGESDAAYAEIMYQRERDGKPVEQADRERCFHPGKGFFAVLMGTIPFIVFTLVFALTAKPSLYTLGGLPGWLQGLRRQNEFGDALRYYTDAAGFGGMDIYRIAVRAMVMPFINAAVLAGDHATLWVERLSPALVCIAPLGFAFGYLGGIKARMRIHTGILIGETKKKRKERRERNRRRRSDSPERLI